MFRPVFTWISCYQLPQSLQLFPLYFILLAVEFFLGSGPISTWTQATCFWAAHLNMHTATVLLSCRCFAQKIAIITLVLVLSRHLIFSLLAEALNTFHIICLADII